jgi:transcriptional regulator with XRE-family HTH domain
MREKLEIIRTNEQMNASELAKKLGVEASAISHIRSGRNKPSFDFVVKILAAFPHINPDWLLLDKGSYRRENLPPTEPVSGESTLDAATLFDAPRAGGDQSENIASMEPQTIDRNITNEFSPIGNNPGKIVERVIVLYSDKSFDSYCPSK